MIINKANDLWYSVNVTEVECSHSLAHCGTRVCVCVSACVCVCVTEFRKEKAAAFILNPGNQLIIYSHSHLSRAQFRNTKRNVPNSMTNVLLDVVLNVYRRERLLDRTFVITLMTLISVFLKVITFCIERPVWLLFLTAVFNCVRGVIRSKMRRPALFPCTAAVYWIIHILKVLTNVLQ